MIDEIREQLRRLEQKTTADDDIADTVMLLCEIVIEQEKQIRALKAKQYKTNRAINEANPDFKGY